jgi:hypothetical protein
LCAKAYRVLRYARERESVLAQKAAERAADPDKFRARDRAIYAANPQKFIDKSTKYAKENPDKIAARDALSRARHPEKHRQRSARYRSEHREEMNKRSAAWHRAHPERDKPNSYYVEWRAKNPDKTAATKHKRRFREAGAPGSYTAAEWRAKKAQHDYRCFDCGMKEGDIFPATAKPKFAGKKMRLSVGHAVPLAAGGSNFIENIYPQCLPCNHRQSWKVHPSVLLRDGDNAA